MKKITSIIMVLAVMLSFASCASKNNGNTDTTKTVTETNPVTETQPTDETKNDISNTSGSALTVIETIWSKYGEDEKFACGGGDSENMNYEGPASFDINKTDELDSTLGLPSSLASNITDAASFMHMMNANTFTGACYTLKNGVDVSGFSKTLKDNILARQWICGTPETLIIINIDDNHVLSAFGAADIINTLKANTEKAYPNSSIMLESAIVE